ncbi:MAG: mercuric reductase [Spirochaetaceae bacterium]
MFKTIISKTVFDTTLYSFKWILLKIIDYYFNHNYELYIGYEKSLIKREEYKNSINIHKTWRVQMKKFDIIIIGTGQATGIIMPELLKGNLNIAVIECDKAGGTCVNWGCTPTKTLIASSRAAYMAKRGADFGVDISEFKINFTKVMHRVNSIRVPATDGYKSWLSSVATYYQFEAKFVDDHKIQVGEEIIYGDKIIIHTGTRSRVPKIPGIDTVPWLDNKGILALKELPKHLIVIGTSYIGLEFGQAFSRLGSKISVLGIGGRILSREDPDISSIAYDILNDEGLEFHLESSIQSMEKSSIGVKIHYIQDGIDKVMEGSHILFAIGRVPNSDGLDLPKAGVKVDKRGFIEVDDYTQTNIPHIYAIGDVNGQGAFTHTSVHDGQVFTEHLSGGTRKISDRIPIHSMFMDPPLARVGLTQTEAMTTGKNVMMATKKMSTISRAQEKDETKGLIKLLIDVDTKLILGATILGVGGDEIIGMVALAMIAKLPYTVLQETVLPHPTVSELIPWIFNDLQKV